MECCVCPTPEIPGINVTYSLEFDSNTSEDVTIECVRASASGEIQITQTEWFADGLGPGVPLTVTRISRWTASGTWQREWSDADLAVAPPPEVFNKIKLRGYGSYNTTNAPSPTIADVTNESESCVRNIETLGFLQPAPNFGTGLGSPIYKEGGYETLGSSFRFYPDLGLAFGGSPPQSATRWRYRIFKNTVTNALVDIYGDGAGPVGAEWRLTFEDLRIASGEIFSSSSDNYLPVPGVPGSATCTENDPETPTYTSVNVTMDIVGEPSSDYSAVVTYTNDYSQEYYITANEDGDGTKTFAIPFPNEPGSVCIASIEFYLREYFVRFKIPLTLCYSASWTLTYPDSSTATTYDTWDGEIPENYDPEDPETWPKLGPFPGEAGVEISDLTGYCQCA